MEPWVEVDGNPSAHLPLEKLTFAVKDLIDIKNTITSCGNPSWSASHLPAAAHALCVQILLEQGANLRGRTITDQFAFGLTGDNCFYGRPLNPKAPDRLPGGSSGGSASAVACGLVDFALGTDTGGSVRVPASNCGIYGFRPSHGLVSVAGVMPFAPSFDTVGWFARTPQILSRVGRALLGESGAPAPKISTLYVLEEAFHSCFTAELSNKLRDFAQRIATKSALDIATLSLRSIDRDSPCYGSEAPLAQWKAAYLGQQNYEVWNSLGSWIDTHKPALGSYIQTNFSFAQAASTKPEEAVAAHKNKIRLARALDHWFEQHGPGAVLCIPTTPSPALKLNHSPQESAAYHHSALSLSAIASVGGLPELTIPGVEIKAPGDEHAAAVGLSLIARRYHDISLLNFAEELLPAF
jgi:amidase